MKLNKLCLAALMAALLVASTASAEDGYVGVMRILDDKVVYLGEDESFYGYDAEADEEEWEEDEYEDEPEEISEEATAETPDEQEKSEELKKSAAQQNHVGQKKVDEKPAADQKQTQVKTDVVVEQKEGLVKDVVGNAKKQDEELEVMFVRRDELYFLPLNDLLLCPDEVVFEDLSFFVSDAELKKGVLNFVVMNGAGSEKVTVKEGEVTKTEFGDESMEIALVKKNTLPKEETAGNASAEPETPISDESHRETPGKPKADGNANELNTNGNIDEPQADDGTDEPESEYDAPDEDSEDE